MKRIAAVLVLVVLIAGCSTHPRMDSVAVAGAPGVVTGTVILGGHPLPGVTVTLIAGNVTRTATTDAHGRYHFAAVPLGVAKLRYVLSGLTTAERRVDVTAQGVAVTTEMRASAVAESITVTASAPGYGYRGLPSSRAMTTTVHETPQPRSSHAPFKEHVFVDARKAPTTTFAIDVDRASYSQIRAFLAANTLPPPDAVRIEEMVNYFAYGYPQPAGAAPFSISTEVAGCPWNASRRLLRVGIQGRNLDDWKMAPNNLVFLIDVSGSMAPPERLPLLKSAFRVLVDQLRAEDRVAIVVYAGAAGIVLPSTSGADKATILAALDRLNAGGSTAGGEGLELAYNVAQENRIANGNNRVILATDGDFNVGISDVGGIEAFIEKKRKSGIYLTTIGVGQNGYRDDMLETLADKGNGNYSYLDGLAEAKKAFSRELTGTLVTIAKDVKVQLEFNPAVVASYRQLGYENRALDNKDFEDDEKDAGDLGAGHSVTALYELQLVTGANGGDVAKVRLRYKEPSADRSVPLEAIATDDGRSIWQASNDLQFASAVAAYGMLLRKSPHAGTVTYADVLQLARMGAYERRRWYARRVPAHGGQHANDQRRSAAGHRGTVEGASASCRRM